MADLFFPRHTAHVASVDVGPVCRCVAQPLPCTYWQREVDVCGKAPYIEGARWRKEETRHAPWSS